MKEDKEWLAKKILFEEFLEWFGKLSREEKLAFNQPGTTNEGFSERARELNYYTTENARTYFEEKIWPQQKDGATEKLEKLLKEQEET